MKFKRTFPFGAIFSIFFYILTVIFDIWNKIGSGQAFLLGVALIVLFLSDWEETRNEKAEEVNEHEL